MKMVQLTNVASPITTSMVASAAASLSSIRCNDEHVFVVRTDPAKQGKASIEMAGADANTSWRCITAEGANVRSAVHEYGGGSFAVVPNNGGVIYTDFPKHQLFFQKLDGSPPIQVFPPPGGPEIPARFADFSVYSVGEYHVIVAVEEFHEAGAGPDKVLNRVAALVMDQSGKLKNAPYTILAQGKDFYASPTAVIGHNNSTMQLAYVAWEHPNMPWDHTSLYVQTVKLETADGSLRLEPSGHAQLVFGGSSSCANPVWSYDHKTLYFLNDVTGWYNLYRYDTQTKQTDPLLAREADFSEAGKFGWLLGLAPFAVLSDGRIASVCHPPPGMNGESESSKFVLITVGPHGAPTDIQEVAVGSKNIPPTAVDSLCACGGALYFLGGSVNDPVALWRWDSPGDDASIAKQVFTTVSDDLARELETIKPSLSSPKCLKFPSDAQVGLGFAYGYYYHPTNMASADLKPPLLVKAHGGPTSSTSTTFRLDIQYWTSRGFAILDVDYGGSTGYGKEFRESLRGQWGILDVADVCEGAKFCVEKEWVNGKWLCIDGKSAGGYTTLAALTFQDTFHAGASLYGVGDLSALYLGTHKFESRYMDRLIGPYPEKKDVYDARCPILKADKLSCPVILLQGDQDKVVPPDQAETMFEALKAKNIPTNLIMYKGEQHGFRKAENIRHSLFSEYCFFCKVFGIEPQPDEEFKDTAIPLGARVDI